jgi:hypothetical protein
VLTKASKPGSLVATLQNYSYDKSAIAEGPFSTMGKYSSAELMRQELKNSFFPVLSTLIHSFHEGRSEGRNVVCMGWGKKMSYRCKR